MRIGIFGGTFDPPHLGHLRAAELARESFSLNEVWLMVSNKPPHKIGKPIIPVGKRLKMAEIASLDNPYIKVSDFEIKNGLSYTIDTLRELKKHYLHDFFLIIGEDSFIELPTWKNYKGLLRETEIIVIKRKWREEKIPEWFLKTGMEVSVLKEGEKASEGRIFFISCATLPISSSMVREKVKRGLSIKYLVPQKIIEYIEKEGLYK